ncbi:hypothetical protein GGD56_005861 [Rhizobium mongolense]|uniref:Glyoxalase/bleomycin resistance protein/dioxygenase superfamily protein n=2 Tax=Rhizobium mongolense TaxID=57676 RepID=A0ABR6IVM5_9HYPH|nr:hypothetical protein [Rhizobium mongolense]MBB4231969.1 hypothetical protein [Rhizobium mongolense]TVZ66920.1 hypothetical protein BCL32_7346 [Rhizobium mongolense USDA 1844]
MSSDPARIEVLPVLPSLDIAETLAFYRDELGFAQIVHQTPDYLIVRRDEMELHFWRTDDASLPEKTSIYMRGGRVAALHARPSSSRPSSRKKSIVPPRSSTTIPTLSIRLSAMFPISKVSFQSTRCRLV